jgi:hypothetical protein
MSPLLVAPTFGSEASAFFFRVFAALAPTAERQRRIDDTR